MGERMARMKGMIESKYPGEINIIPYALLLL